MKAALKKIANSYIMKTIKKYFNYKDPKAWGSLVTLAGGLLVQYIPFGQYIIDFVKDNPTEFIAAASALASGLGLLNQKGKTTTTTTTTGDEPTLVNPTTEAPNE